MHRQVSDELCQSVPKYSVKSVFPGVFCVITFSWSPSKHSRPSAVVHISNQWPHHTDASRPSPRKPALLGPCMHTHAAAFSDMAYRTAAVSVTRCAASSSTPPRHLLPPPIPAIRGPLDVRRRITCRRVCRLARRLLVRVYPVLRFILFPPSRTRACHVRESCSVVKDASAPPHFAHSGEREAVVRQGGHHAVASHGAFRRYLLSYQVGASLLYHFGVCLVSSRLCLSFWHPRTALPRRSQSRSWLTCTEIRRSLWGAPVPKQHYADHPRSSLQNFEAYLIHKVTGALHPNPIPLLTVPAAGILSGTAPVHRLVPGLPAAIPPAPSGGAGHLTRPVTLLLRRPLARAHRRACSGKQG